MAELLNRIPTNLTEYPNSFKRQGAFPLEAYSVFYTMEAAETYASSNPIAYVGQTLAVVTANAEDATVVDNVTFYIISDATGTLQEVGKATNGDDKTVKLNADGKIELVGITGLDSTKTYVPSLVNGILTWAEPDTKTAEGQTQEINALKTRATALEETINGKGEGEERVAGLVEKVAALEEVDNATQAELDAYKEVVTGAIATALQTAKDYADENDANTIYDDTALANRVKALEDEERYDETPIANRVGALEEIVGDAEDGLVKDVSDNTIAIANEKTRAEAAEKALGERIDAIDFVDTDELAIALEPYAKTAAVNTELDKKATVIALEALEGRVNAFLTGTGAADALDSLQELIEYINTHDDVEISGILEDIQAIENKLEGIDTTVAAYVTAAIDAIKIGDYAKAADLTALVGRVEALEGKPFETYATKTEVQDVDAKFAHYTTTENLNTALAGKVANDDFETFKGENTTTINNAKEAAIAAAKSETETQVGALEEAVAENYATKTALAGVKETADAAATKSYVDTELDKKANADTIYTKSEIDIKIGTPGIPASDGVEKTDGTGIFASTYSKAEINVLLDEIDGGSTESVASVARQLDEFKSATTNKLNLIDQKDADQDTAINAAKDQADKGVADAQTAQTTADNAATAIATLASGQVATNKNSIDVLNAIVGVGTDADETSHAVRIGALEGANAAHTAEFNSLKGRVDTNEIELAKKANAADVYNKASADSLLATKANAEAVYTKGETDAAILAAKPDLTPYAKSTDVEASVLAINKALDTKANASAVYTKEEANTEFMTEGEVDARINALIAAADPEDGKVITDIQNLVKYVDENAGEIAGLLTTVGENTEAIGENASDIADIKADLAEVVQPKGSDEINVAADGTIGIEKVNVNKLVQTDGDVLILYGGDAGVTVN